MQTQNGNVNLSTSVTLPAKKKQQTVQRNSTVITQPTHVFLPPMTRVSKQTDSGNKSDGSINIMQTQNGNANLSTGVAYIDSGADTNQTNTNGMSNAHTGESDQKKQEKALKQKEKGLQKWEADLKKQATELTEVSNELASSRVIIERLEYEKEQHKKAMKLQQDLIDKLKSSTTNSQQNVSSAPPPQQQTSYSTQQPAAHTGGPQLYMPQPIQLPPVHVGGSTNHDLQMQLLQKDMEYIKLQNQFILQQQAQIVQQVQKWIPPPPPQFWMPPQNQSCPPQSFQRQSSNRNTFWKPPRWQENANQGRENPEKERTQNQERYVPPHMRVRQDSSTRPDSNLQNTECSTNNCHAQPTRSEVDTLAPELPEPSKQNPLKDQSMEDTPAIEETTSSKIGKAITRGWSDILPVATSSNPLSHQTQDFLEISLSQHHRK